MLRMIFVSSIALVGIYFAAQGAFYALLLYLWIAYFRPESWMWDPTLVLSLKLSLLSGAYLLVRSAGEAKFRFDIRSALLFTFLGISLASTLASPHNAYSWPYWIEFAKALIVTYLLRVLVTDRTKFRITLIVIGLSVGFESAKQGWVTMLLSPGSRNDNGFPVFGDNNGVAVGMLMLSSIFIALAQTTTVRWEKWLHRFFAGGLLYRGLSTYSRGGFLSALVLAVLTIARSKHKVRSTVSAVVLAVVILPLMPETFWNRMATIMPASASSDLSSSLYSNEAAADPSRESDDISSRSRLHFWQVAVAMANANPILGVGHNAYNVAYNSYDFLAGFYGRGRSVHSSWFGVLGELGYAGLLIYVAIIGLAIVASWGVTRRARRGEIPQELGFYGVALQNGLAVFVVGGSFVPWQYCEMLWHFVGLSYALRAISLAPETAAAPALPEPPVAAEVATAATAAVLARRPAGWPQVRRT